MNINKDIKQASHAHIYITPTDLLMYDKNNTNQEIINIIKNTNKKEK